MVMHRLLRIFTFSLIIGMVGPGCSRDSDEFGGSLRSEDGLLRYVPADTPYLVVTPGDIPDDVVDKLSPHIDAALRAYASILGEIAGGTQPVDAAGADVAPAVPAAEQFVDGLVDLMSVEGLQRAGIDRNTDIAIYGVGLIPVMRLSLSGGDLMEAAIADLESRPGESMAVGTIDGTEYRYVGDEAARFILSVLDNELVVSLVPGELGEPLLRRVLGLTLPDQNIAQAGTLAAVAERHEFSDYLIGIVDFERLAEVFLSEQTGVNAELHRMMGYDPGEISDVCKSELAGLAGIAPRLVSGYTDLTVSRIASKLVIELREDIAAGVAAMTGAVPGLGSSSDGLVTFGMGVDLLAAREFYAGQLQNLDEAPFECELLSGLQAEVSAGRAALNSPVPPIVYGIKGFLAEITRLEGGDIANGIPPNSIDLRMILATDNAEGLIAMGAMFSPDLMALNVEPDGEPVRLELPAVRATGQVVHLAMTDNALGVSVGVGMEQGLKDMLNAPVVEPGPFIAVDMDAVHYYGMMNDAVLGDGGDLDNMPDIKAAVSDLMQTAQRMLDRISFVVNFSRGRCRNAFRGVVAGLETRIPGPWHGGAKGGCADNRRWPHRAVDGNACQANASRRLRGPRRERQRRRQSAVRAQFGRFACRHLLRTGFDEGRVLR